MLQHTATHLGVNITMIVLQVDAQGRSWRSGALVEQKKLRQWFLKVTDFADDLVDGLDSLPDWPDKVKALQKSWIGRSHGAIFKFSASAHSGEAAMPIHVFTSVPDSLPGVSFIAVAGDHPFATLAQRMAATSGDVERARDLEQLALACTSRSALEAEADQELRAVNTGLTVKHPISGHDV